MERRETETEMGGREGRNRGAREREKGERVESEREGGEPFVDELSPLSFLAVSLFSCRALVDLPHLAPSPLSSISHYCPVQWHLFPTPNYISTIDGPGKSSVTVTVVSVPYRTAPYILTIGGLPVR